MIYYEEGEKTQPQTHTLQVQTLPFPFDFAGQTVCLLRCSLPHGKEDVSLPGPARSLCKQPTQEGCPPATRSTSTLWTNPQCFEGFPFNAAAQGYSRKCFTISGAFIICGHLQFCAHKSAYKSQQRWWSINRSPKVLAHHGLTKGKHGRLAGPRTLCEVVLFEVDYEQPRMWLLSSSCTCQPNKGA